MPTKSLLVATTNQGKLVEFVQGLTGIDWRVVSLNDVAATAQVDVEETGSTFQENAELKAKTYATLANMVTIAEDSGLVVPALGGKPGIYSKRFFPGSDSDRNQHLIELLAKSSDRTAYFITVICMYNPETSQANYFEGTVMGTIANQPQGDAGFGYDPIFIPDGYDETFAQLGALIKNEVSHRARAIVKLRSYLQEKQ